MSSNNKKECNNLSRLPYLDLFKYLKNESSFPTLALPVQQRSPANTDILCDECSNRKAVAFCAECDQYLCQDDDVVVHKSGMRVKHLRYDAVGPDGTPAKVAAAAAAVAAAAASAAAASAAATAAATAATTTSSKFVVAGGLNVEPEEDSDNGLSQVNEESETPTPDSQHRSRDSTNSTGAITAITTTGENQLGSQLLCEVCDEKFALLSCTSCLMVVCKSCDEDLHAKDGQYHWHITTDLQSAFSASTGAGVAALGLMGSHNKHNQQQQLPKVLKGGALTRDGMALEFNHGGEASLGVAPFKDERSPIATLKRGDTYMRLSSGLKTAYSGWEMNKWKSPTSSSSSSALLGSSPTSSTPSTPSSSTTPASPALISPARTPPPIVADSLLPVNTIPVPTPVSVPVPSPVRAPTPPTSTPIPTPTPMPASLSLSTLIPIRSGFDSPVSSPSCSPSSSWSSSTTSVPLHFVIPSRLTKELPSFPDLSSSPNNDGVFGRCKHPTRFPPGFCCVLASRLHCAANTLNTPTAATASISGSGLWEYPESPCVSYHWPSRTPIRGSQVVREFTTQEPLGEAEEFKRIFVPGRLNHDEQRCRATTKAPVDHYYYERYLRDRQEQFHQLDLQNYTSMGILLRNTLQLTSPEFDEYRDHSQRPRQDGPPLHPNRLSRGGKLENSTSYRKKMPTFQLGHIDQKCDRDPIFCDDPTQEMDNQSNNSIEDSDSESEAMSFCESETTSQIVCHEIFGTSPDCPAIKNLQDSFDLLHAEIQRCLDL